MKRLRIKGALERCIVCQYDLRHTPARCPECGWRVGSRSSRQRDSWSYVLATLLVLLPMIAVIVAEMNGMLFTTVMPEMFDRIPLPRWALAGGVMGMLTLLRGVLVERMINKGKYRYAVAELGILLPALAVSDVLLSLLVVGIISMR